MQKTLFAKILKGVSLFTLMLPLIGLQSCKDDPHNYDEPKVSIEPTPQNNTFVFEQTAGSNELTIKTNRKWSISTSGEDWFAITPTSGEVGEHKITVTVLANEGEAREGQFTITASSKKFTFNIQQKSKSGKEIEYTPLSVLIEKAKNVGQQGITIDEDLRIRAVVTTHYQAKQFPFAAFHYIQDAQGNAMVATLMKGSGDPIEFGTQITASLKGRKLSNYNGTVQIELDGKEVVKVPNMAIEPKDVTLQDVLDGKCINQYIRIKGVQFKTYNNVLYYDGDFSTKRHIVEDKEGHEATLEIWKNCVWGGEKVATGSGTLTCIATTNVSAKSGKVFHNLRPTQKEDIAFTEARFNVGGGDPTKVSSFSVSSTSLNFNKEGGTQTLTVTTDAASFTATSSQPWLKVTADVPNNKVTVVCEKNTSAEERTATLKLEHNGVLRAAPKTITVNVSQSASGETPQPKGWDGGVIKLREASKAGKTKVEEELTIEAVVLNNIRDNNNSFKNLIVSDGKAGIAIRLKENADKSIKLGTVLKITIPAGSELTRYKGGTLQLNNLPNSSLEILQKVITIEPIEVTFADLMSDRISDDLESRLVKVSGVQFQKAGIPFKGDKNTYHPLVESSASQPAPGFNLPGVFASSYNKWNLTIPEGNGTIVGATSFSTYNSKKGCNLFIRSVGDLQLNGPRK